MRYFDELKLFTNRKAKNNKQQAMFTYSAIRSLRVSRIVRLINKAKCCVFF